MRQEILYIFICFYKSFMHFYAFLYIVFIFYLLCKHQEYICKDLLRNK